MSTGFLKFFYHALSGVRVQKVQKVQRVQRVVVAADAAGCIEGLHRFAQGATAPAALRVADCRSAAMLIKSALRIYLSVSYGMISILVINRCAAPPYPAAPEFLHGKACHTILRSLCSLTNRVPLPPHPGDRIKPREILSS